MNLVGYVRVSSEGQADGYGPDVQEHSIRAWCKSHDHRLVTITSDVGVSGTKPADERPGLSEALDMLRPPPMAVEKRRAAGLVIARLDRLARELTVQEAIFGLVWRDGGSVFTADYGEVLADDPDDPMRTALRQVAGVFARARPGADRQAPSGWTTGEGRDPGRKAVGDHAYGYQGGGTGRYARRGGEPDRTGGRCAHPRTPPGGQLVPGHRRRTGRRGTPPLPRAERWSPMTVRSVVLREMPASAQPTT